MSYGASCQRKVREKASSWRCRDRRPHGCRGSDWRRVGSMLAPMIARLLAAASLAGFLGCRCGPACDPAGDPSAGAPATKVVLTAPEWSAEDTVRTFQRAPDERASLSDGGEELVWRWPAQDGAQEFELAFRFDADGRLVSVRSPVSPPEAGQGRILYTIERGEAGVR